MYIGDWKKGEIEVTQENLIFENKFVQFFNDDVIFSDGTKGTYFRLKYNCPYSVGVCLFHKNGLYLVRSFRHETRRWGWETVQGYGESLLTPLNCAEKEIREETGKLPVNTKFVLKSTENGLERYLYEAELGEPCATPHEIGESITGVTAFSYDELEDLINTPNEIHDSFTQIVIQRALLLHTKM